MAKIVEIRHGKLHAGHGGNVVKVEGNSRERAGNIGCTCDQGGASICLGLEVTRRSAAIAVAPSDCAWRQAPANPPGSWTRHEPRPATGLTAHDFAPPLREGSRSSTVSEWLSPVLPPMNAVFDTRAHQVIGQLFDHRQIESGLRRRRAMGRGERPTRFEVCLDSNSFFANDQKFGCRGTDSVTRAYVMLRCRRDQGLSENSQRGVVTSVSHVAH